MKRLLALALCAILLAGAFAACGADNEIIEMNVYDTEVFTIPGEDETFVDIEDVVPDDYYAFASVSADGTIRVFGLCDLYTWQGELIVVDNTSRLEANYGTFEGDENKIVSVFLAGDLRYIPTKTVDKDGVRTLYAKGRNAADDPANVLVTMENGMPLATVATIRTLTPVTTRATTTTKPPPVLASVETVRTTKYVPTTVGALQLERDKINNSNMNDWEKQSAISLLSYMIDENGIFYTETDPWQKQFGFNPFYDMFAPYFQLVYGTVRVLFTYDYVYKVENGVTVKDSAGNPEYLLDDNGERIPKDWMIQLWKGRYGFVMLGGEIGIYTKPHTQTATHYQSGVKEEFMQMKMEVYQHSFVNNKTKYLFTRSDTTWWLTGFVTGSFENQSANNQGKDEIIMVGSIKFPNREMFDLFEAGMAEAGFKKGTPSASSVEKYNNSGYTFTFSWQYVDVDGRR